MAHLFTTIAELKAAVPSIDANMTEANIFPYVDDAAEAYLINYISRAYYDELVAQHAGSTLTAANLITFTLIQKALGNYTLYDAFPFLNLKVGDGGVAENSNSETTPTRQWLYNQSRRSYLQKADRHLDAALLVMETTPANYTTWAVSSAYTVYTQYFLTNATEYSKRLGINDSRRTFLKLVPYMQIVEDRHIKPAIGSTLFDYLKENLDTADEYKIEILRMLRLTLAYFTMFYGSNQLKLNISSDGIMVVSTNDGLESKTSADPKLYNEWRKDILAFAEGYLGDLKTYLDDNSASITEYADDDAADDDYPATTFPDNSSSKASVMI